MKTAVIVAGVSRHTKFAVSSWNNLPEADWYLSTWDVISYNHNSGITYPLGNEIDHMRDKFKEIVISKYSEYIDNAITNNLNQVLDRPFYLLNKIYDIIKDKNYERIIYFRPDLRLFYLENYTYNDFDIDDNTSKLLGMFEPEKWYIRIHRYIDDFFFVFSWNTFKLFLENRFNIKPDLINVHPFIFDFFENNNVKIKTLHNMRSVLLRHTINNNNYQRSYEKLTELFNITENNTHTLGII